VKDDKLAFAFIARAIPERPEIPDPDGSEPEPALAE